MHREPTFGHVKLVKMMCLTEHLCNIDTGSHYCRKAAGPYDNRALSSIDSQIKRQKWYEAKKTGSRYEYVHLEKAGSHSRYFNDYFNEVHKKFDQLVEMMRTWKTIRCEILATAYSAWKDFLDKGKNPTDDEIVYEILHNSHENKKKVSKDRWLSALKWMRENNITPQKV